MMRYRVITTCNADGWKQYGRAMAESFVKFWPHDVHLTVYAEGFEPDVDGIFQAPLPSWLTAFKDRHKDHAFAHGRASSRYDFKRDCVRFAHKVGAITHAASLCGSSDILIWMDADTITHDRVTDVWLAGLFNSKAYMAWLDRDHNYPECGFLMFRGNVALSHASFMNSLRSIYVTDSVFALPETHDSYVIQRIAEKCVKDRVMDVPHSLSDPRFRRGHVFIHSKLAEKLDHKKGARKEQGRTPAVERKIRDSIPYWAKA